MVSSSTPSSNILVINSGSSSIKFALFDMNNQQAMLTGLAERLNETPQISWKIADTNKASATLQDQGHEAAFAFIIQLLEKHDLLEGVSGVGHRVVHGGESFSASVEITDQVLQQLDKLNHLAPLHNPVNVQGIRAAQKLLPNVPQVAVFDTAFHQTMPQAAYMYAVPLDWYQQYGVRRYGFHGTSYRYIVGECARRLNKEASDLNILCAHLGNGCSATAIRHGESIDTSMGLTPIEGLAMGTRSGNIDPGLVEFIANIENKNIADVMQVLNKKSGLLGLSGISNDMRTLLEHEQQGNDNARLAIDTFCYRVARELSALSVGLERIDAIVFTGGIGEHAAVIRARIMAFWRNSSIQLDQDLNNKNGDQAGCISIPGSDKAMVIATNEELMIAQDTFGVCQHA
jgi:acetate kinase